MYKIRIKRRSVRKPVKVVYFKDWASACEYCALVGIRIKVVKAA